jgi:hypothetical protein
LKAHNNCGHERGTNNGMKNCSSPVMPQKNWIDRAIKTLNLNVEFTAKNTSIMVSQQMCANKTWYHSPTDVGHITDPCKNMLMTE